MGAEKEAVIGGIREIAKRPGEVDKTKVDKILLAGRNGFKNDVLIWWKAISGWWSKVDTVLQMPLNRQQRIMDLQQAGEAIVCTVGLISRCKAESCWSQWQATMKKSMYTLLSDSIVAAELWAYVHNNMWAINLENLA